SRKQNGSKHRAKAKQRQARVAAAVANQRVDFHRKAARRLLSTYDRIGVEDLRITRARPHGRRSCRGSGARPSWSATLATTQSVTDSQPPKRRGSPESPVYRKVPAWFGGELRGKGPVAQVSRRAAYPVEAQFLCDAAERVEHALDNFRVSGPEDDIGIIRSDHTQRRRVASASRKLGVVFFGYRGRGIQVVVVPCVGMYQVRIAAYSHSESGLEPWTPFEVLRKPAIPTSMPALRPVDSRGFSDTPSQESTRNHLRSSRLVDIAKTSPSVAQCTVTFTWPSSETDAGRHGVPADPITPDLLGSRDYPMAS
ncbi:MAG: transposase, partial [Acidimicrobiales bacterium]